MSAVADDTAPEGGGTVSGPVTLLILRRAKPGREADLLSLTVPTFARIRAEEAACRVLTGNRGVDHPAEFMVYEEWSDRAELERFSATREHMQEFFAQSAPHIEHAEHSFWQRFV